MPQLVTKCVATTGPAGAAAGSAGGFVQPGRLTAVEVDYAAGQPATTDLTVTVGGRTVLTLANQATDRVVNPRVPVQDAAGADIAGRGEETPFVSRPDGGRRAGEPRHHRDRALACSGPSSCRGYSGPTQP